MGGLVCSQLMPEGRSEHLQLELALLNHSINPAWFGLHKHNSN